MSHTKPQHETQPQVASALSPVQGVKLIAERELQMAFAPRRLFGE